LARGEFKITALNKDNEPIEVVIQECPHCKESIPKVGNCPECNTPLKHLITVENFNTGYTHFVYECAGCPPKERRTQKIIKMIDVVDEARINLRKNLADEFLKSGGY